MKRKNPRQLGFRMPAEWELHEATWLTWPKDPLTWPGRLPQAEEAYARMIEALTPYEKVRLLVDDEDAEAKVRKKLSEKKINQPNLILHRIPTIDSWIRDYGPIFLVRANSVETGPHPPVLPPAGGHPLPKGRGDLLILDWIFNGWGDKYADHKKDDPIPQKIAPLLDIPWLEPGIVMEGGSIDVNGEGALLTTEQCLLNPNRNPSLRKEEIEGYLRDFLGVSHILWLGDGIAGDDTDGHVDDITRFVAADTVVTAVEEDPRDENYAPLQENLRRLRKMTLLNGRPLKVVTLPMPGPVESGEGRLPASYANFYIANGVVIVPIFGHANDRRALSALQELFPDRAVKGIEASDLVWGLGAFHCLTQQQPAGYTG